VRCSNDYPPPSSTEVEERIELYLHPTAHHVTVDFTLKGRRHLTGRVKPLTNKTYWLQAHTPEYVLCIKNTTYILDVNNCKISQIKKTLTLNASTIV